MNLKYKKYTITYVRQWQLVIDFKKTYCMISNQLQLIKEHITMSATANVLNCVIERYTNRWDQIIRIIQSRDTLTVY